jgi:hypothetical protein
MSIIQSIIGTAIYSEQGGGGGGEWIYPPPGNGYPVAMAEATGDTQAPVVGYYEASSVGTPSLGLYRRTFLGQAFGGDYVQDPDFPSTYNVAQNINDPAVGFANNLDVATNFTMEWMGYFRPAVNGDFIFAATIDDYFAMWIGQDAVSGFNASNAILKAANQFHNSLAYPMLANKYYPVRLRFVENQGAHNCAIWSGLKDAGALRHNQDSAATGQFFYDPTFVMGFPGSGLIV